MPDSNETARRCAEARRWAAEHGEGLVGGSRLDAEAALQDAGLRVKVLRPAGWTLEYGIGRITLHVDDEDRVTGVSVG
jgi:hypothetical protein